MFSTIGWEYLFILSSFIILLTLPFIRKLPEFVQRSQLGLQAIGPVIFFSGIMLIFFNLFVSVCIISVGAFISFKRPLKTDFIKGSSAGYLHSISRSAITIFLVLFYSSAGFSPIITGFLVFIFPLSFISAATIGGKFSDRIGLNRTAYMGFAFTAIFSLILLFNSVLVAIIASVLIGIGSGISTTSNTAFTINKLQEKERIVGSSLRTLQGVTSFAVGLQIETLLFPEAVAIIVLVTIPNIVATFISISYKGGEI